MSDADRDEVTVSADGITVRKSLNTDQFQTPAVVFDVRSTRDGPVDLRLVDSMPPAVSMDDVGFHPDYGGEHWTTSGQDVVFERTFEAGEEYTTIYGIRGIEEDVLERLHTEPAVELLEEDAPGEGDLDELDDLLSADDTQAVKDVIAGERDTLPGLEESEEAPEEAAEATGEPATEPEPSQEPAEAPESPGASGPDAGDPLAEDTAGEEAADPAGADDDLLAEAETSAEAETEDVLTGGEEPEAEPADEAPDLAAEGADDAERGEAASAAEGADGTGEGEPVEAGGSETPGTAEPAAPEEADAPGDASAGGASEGGDEATQEGTPTVPVTGGVARVLAKELREGNVSEEDRRLLRDELAFTEGSTESRIRHLQGRLSDLEAYTDALEEFLDENGTAQELLDDLAAEMDHLHDRVDGLEDGVDDLREEVDDIGDGVESIREELGDDVERVEGRLERTSKAVDDLEERVESIESTASGLAEDVEDLREDRELVEEIDDDLESLEKRVDDLAELEGVQDRIDDLAADLATVRDDVEEMAQFRQRLSTVLGGQGGGGEADEE